MAVPSLLSALSTTAATNPPAAGESVFPDLDNYLRQVFAFLAEVRDAIAAIDTGTGYALIAGTTFTGPIAVPFVTLTDAATITTNAALGNNFIVTLGANRVMQNPTGLIDGGRYEWWIKQDATGGRTLSWGSFFKFPGGVAPTLTATAAGLDRITGTYNAALAVLVCTASLDVR